MHAMASNNIVDEEDKVLRSIVASSEFVPQETAFGKDAVSHGVLTEVADVLSGAAQVAALVDGMSRLGLSGDVIVSVVFKMLDVELVKANIELEKVKLAVAEVQDADSVRSQESVSSVSSRTSRKAIRQRKFLAECDASVDVEGFCYLRVIERTRRLVVRDQIGAFPKLQQFLKIDHEAFDMEMVRRSSFVRVEREFFHLVEQANGDAERKIRNTLACFSTYGTNGLRSKFAVGQFLDEAVLPCFAVIGGSPSVQSAIKYGDAEIDHRFESINNFVYNCKPEFDLMIGSASSGDVRITSHVVDSPRVVEVLAEAGTVLDYRQYQIRVVEPTRLVLPCVTKINVHAVDGQQLLARFVVPKVIWRSSVYQLLTSYQRLSLVSQFDDYQIASLDQFGYGLRDAYVTPIEALSRDRYRRRVQVRVLRSFRFPDQSYCLIDGLDRMATGLDLETKFVAFAFDRTDINVGKFKLGGEYFVKLSFVEFVIPNDADMDKLFHWLMDDEMDYIG